MVRISAICVLAFALTGCGTVQNFKRESPDDATVYGGVKIAVDGFTPESEMAATWLKILWPVVVADVALSAIGDTLTLPVTVPNAIVHAVHESIRNYYFPPDKPAATETPQPAPNP